MIHLEYFLELARKNEAVILKLKQLRQISEPEVTLILPASFVAMFVVRKSFVKWPCAKRVS